MKETGKFIKRNVIIFVFFVSSVIIIFSYIVVIDFLELFVIAEPWLNLLFALSIGYIINFMFYITQVYIPNNKRDLTVRQCMSKRLDKIQRNMKSSLSSLAEVYLENHNGDNFTEDDFKQLLKLKFSDKVKVLKANQTTGDNFVYFSVREWLLECILKTEREIDSLYKYYASDITVDLMISLENVLNSEYHTVMKTILTVPNDVDFSEYGVNFFVEYYDSINQLKLIQRKDYE